MNAFLHNTIMTGCIYLCDLFPQVDDAEPVAEAREVLQLGTALL